MYTDPAAGANRRPPARIVYQGADAIRQVWLTKLVCSFAEVALEDGRPAAQVLTQEVSRRAELLLCADDVRWRLQPEDAEDEPVVAEALADFERDLWFWLMLWSEAAEVAFGDLIDHDRAIRQRLAAQLERLEQESIFVRSAAGCVTPPGSQAPWLKPRTGRT